MARRDRARSEKAKNQLRDEKGRFLKGRESSESESGSGGSSGRRPASPTSSGTTSEEPSSSRTPASSTSTSGSTGQTPSSSRSCGEDDFKSVQIHGSKTDLRHNCVKQEGTSKIQRSNAKQIWGPSNVRTGNVQLQRTTIILDSSSSDEEMANQEKEERKQKGKEKLKEKGNKKMQRKLASPTEMIPRRTIVLTSSSSEEELVKPKKESGKEKGKEKEKVKVKEDKAEDLDLLKLHNQLASSQEKIACLDSQLKKEKMNKRRLEQELSRASKKLGTG